MSTIPIIELVPLTVAERNALALLPALVAALTDGPTSTPRSNDSVPSLTQPARPAPVAPVAPVAVTPVAPVAAAPAKSIGEHLSAPVPTLDDLRAACGRAAARMGGNPAALARMATFGAKRVADVPEAKRALFVAYMDGDDAAKA